MDTVFLIAVIIVLAFLPFMSETLCHFLIFSCLFFEGILQLINIPTIYSKIFAETLIFILFFKCLFEVIINKKTFKVYGLGPIIVVFFSSLYSYFINNLLFISYVYFLRIIFIFYFYYLSLLNSSMKIKQRESIKKFIITIFVIQIPAVFIKYLMIGQTESGGIGTLSIDEGSLSTIVPLFAIAFLFSNYLYKKQNIYLWFIVFFVGYGIVGAKRAIIVYVPILVLFVFMLKHFVGKYAYFEVAGKIGLRIKYIVLSLFFVVFLVYITAITNPSLNPEGLVGGSFDIGHIKNYIIEYETRTREGNEQYLGRLAAPTLVYNVVNGEGFEKILFGLGPGEIIETRFVAGSKDVLLEKYGIGYGARTGVLWLFFQIGLVGTVGYLFFLLKMFKVGFLESIRTRTVETRILGISFLGFLTVYCFDFFTYSYAMMRSGALLGTLFFSLSYLQVKLSGLKSYENLTS